MSEKGLRAASRRVEEAIDKLVNSPEVSRIQRAWISLKKAASEGMKRLEEEDNE